MIALIRESVEEVDITNKSGTLADSLIFCLSAFLSVFLSDLLSVFRFRYQFGFEGVSLGLLKSDFQH